MSTDGPEVPRDRANRAKVTLTCEVRQGTRPWKKTRLEDISADGFRIAWLPNCLAHMPLRVRIPGLQMLTAHIRWQDEGSVGCQFDAPLHPAVFDHIARNADNA